MFKQSINMWVGSLRYVVVRSCRVLCMAIIYARRIFCNPSHCICLTKFLQVFLF